MNSDEAAAALASVSHTENRLAERVRWPLWRHAAFGLAETIIVFGLSLPGLATGLCAVAGLLLVALIYRDDKKRYGMFVSGWQKGRTMPLTIGLVVVMLACCALSLAARGEPAPAPLALLAAGLTFTLCTLASLWWEKLYRADLSTKRAR